MKEPKLRASCGGGGDSAIAWSMCVWNQFVSRLVSMCAAMPAAIVPRTLLPDPVEAPSPEGDAVGRTGCVRGGVACSASAPAAETEAGGRFRKDVARYVSAWLGNATGRERSGGA